MPNIPSTEFNEVTISSESEKTLMPYDLLPHETHIPQVSLPISTVLPKSPMSLAQTHDSSTVHLTFLT